MWQLVVEKDRFKFSSAHMTIFADGTKEALHGHNYQVRLRIGLSSTKLEQTISFSVFKKILGPLCEAWDEQILIAVKNKHTQYEISDGEFRASICGKKYLFPEEEVVTLDVENVTSEVLAAELTYRFVNSLEQAGYWGEKLPGDSFDNPVRQVTIEVMETLGQGASYTLERESGKA